MTHPVARTERRAKAMLAVGMLLVACDASSAQTAPIQSERGREGIERTMREIGARVVGAVRRKDPGGILDLVAYYGIACGDVEISRERVARDLSQKGTRPNAYLFDSETFDSKYRKDARVASLAEVVGGPGGSSEVTVVFSPGVQGLDFGSPCIYFGPSSLGKLRPWLCFLREKDGKWVLVDSLYDC